jgi:hypothetical protein
VYFPLARRLVVAVGLLAVITLAAAAVLTELVERRIAARVETQLARSVAVELQPWWAGVRLLVGAPVDVLVEDDAPGGPPLRLRLSAVHAPGAARSLLRGANEIVFSAPRARLEGAVPADVPFGAASFVALAGNAEITLSQHETRITFDSVQLLSPPAGARQRVLLQGVVVAVGENGAQLRVTARRGVAHSLRAVAQPFRAERIELRFTDATYAEGSLTAREATVEAREAALDEGRADLARVEARLPDLRVSLAGRSVVLRTSGGRFEAVLDERDVNELWRFPGRVEFLRERVQLVVGPIRAGFEVDVENDALRLTPALPPPLRPLFDDPPSLSIAPALPSGATLTEAVAQRDLLLLRGRISVLTFDAPGS